MLYVYVTQGKIFDDSGEAYRAEQEAFEAWLTSDETASKIVSACTTDNAAEVLRDYWASNINRNAILEDVKLINPKECTVEIGSPDVYAHVNGIGLWC